MSLIIRQAFRRGELLPHADSIRLSSNKGLTKKRVSKERERERKQTNKDRIEE